MPCHKSWNADSGTARSSTSSVVAIANTLSLNASVRPVSHLPLTASLLVRRRPARSYASIDRLLCRGPTHGQPGRGPSTSDQASGKDRPHRGTRSLLDRATSIADVWLLLGLRAGAGAGAQPRSRDCLLEGDAGAGVHHRRPPLVDGRDDL